MKAPAHTLWVLFLSSFTFSFGYSSEDLVISLLEKGKEEAEKGKANIASQFREKAEENLSSLKKKISPIIDKLLLTE